MRDDAVLRRALPLGRGLGRERLFSSPLVPVPIYTAWWTEARVCEQLAQGCYVERPGFEPRDLSVASPMH